MFERVRELVSNQMGISKDEITLESRLIEDIKADSIDAAEIIISLESDLDLEIDDEAILNVKTIGDIVKYLEEAKK